MAKNKVAHFSGHGVPFTECPLCWKQIPKHATEDVKLTIRWNFFLGKSKLDDRRHLFAVCRGP